MFYFDSTFIILIPALIFTMYAQMKVQSTFSKYSNIRNSKGISGAKAARMVLDSNGLGAVPINIINGNALNNYYDPRSKSLNLSQEVASKASIASISVACHEVGHAMQDAERYPLLSFRNSLVPVVNLTQTFSIPLIIIGMLLTASTTFGSTLFNIGVICFCVVVLFHLVTLPVELNASRRALDQLDSMGIVSDDDFYGSEKVLSAAAMTYIAALATAVANLLRILMLSRNRD